MSTKLSLDYIPILRQMAVSEKDAIDSFEKLKVTSDDDESFATHSRRLTGRRVPIVREYYFKNLMVNYRELETVLLSLYKMGITSECDSKFSKLE